MQDRPHVRPYVFLALPQRPGEGMSNGLWEATQPDAMGTGFDLRHTCAQPMSLLTTNFNTLWCTARNLRTSWFLGSQAQRTGTPRDANPYAKERYAQGWWDGWDHAAGVPGARPPVTDYLMVHSDVAPQPGRWVQDLLEEKRRLNADIVSGVVPLKDDSGNSSTGVMRWQTQEIAKLTMRQCLSLPVSFTARDAGADVLLINTGLLLMDLTRPWARRVCFRIYDTILEDQDGITKATAVGEDWLLGIDAYRMGLRVYATTKVRVHHRGQFDYPNYAAFGSNENENEWGTPWCVEPPAHWRWLDQGVQQNPRASRHVTV